MRAFTRWKNVSASGTLGRVELCTAPLGPAATIEVIAGAGSTVSLSDIDAKSCLGATVSVRDGAGPMSRMLTTEAPDNGVAVLRDGVVRVDPVDKLGTPGDRTELEPEELVRRRFF